MAFSEWAEAIATERIRYLKAHGKADWDALSYNDALPLRAVAENLEAPWDWHVLSAHKNIPWQFIAAHPDRPWDWNNVCVNPNITAAILRRYANAHPWNWAVLSRHPNLEWDIVAADPFRGWNWWDVSGHPNVAWETIEANATAFPWVWEAVSTNPNVRAHVVARRADLPWDWFRLAHNAAFVQDLWKENDAEGSAKDRGSPSSPSWRVAMRSAVLRRIVPATADENDDHVVEQQSFGNASHRWSKSLNATWDEIRAHPQFPWHWGALSANPHTTWERVCERPEAPWDWSMISGNPRIGWEHVQAAPHAPWNWSIMSLNPNMSWTVVVENLDRPWDFSMLCFFASTLTPTDEELCSAVRRCCMVRRIQRAFLRAYYDPSHPLCRRRLRREFEALLLPPSPSGGQAGTREKRL